MDRVPLTIDGSSNRAVDNKGTKSVERSAHEKTRYTSTLARCADGIKLPSLLIFEQKPTPRNIIPLRNFIRVHAKERRDENGLKLWIEKLWAKRSLAY
jgi:hypothetical protein